MDMMSRYEEGGRLEQYLAKFPKQVVEFGQYVGLNWSELYHHAASLTLPLTPAMKKKLPKPAPPAASQAAAEGAIVPVRPMKRRPAACRMRPAAATK